MMNCVVSLRFTGFTSTHTQHFLVWFSRKWHPIFCGPYSIILSGFEQKWGPKCLLFKIIYMLVRKSMRNADFDTFFTFFETFQLKFKMSLLLESFRYFLISVPSSIFGAWESHCMIGITIPRFYEGLCYLIKIGIISILLWQTILDLHWSVL